MSSARHELTCLSERGSLLIRIFDKLPGLVAYWDTEQRCRFANADYERWFGIKPEKLIGMTLSEVLGPIYQMNLPHILAALQGEEQLFDREIPDPQGGPPRYSQAHYIPDVLNGVVQGFVVMVSDISSRRKLELQLREAQERANTMAMHDSLTGLPNRALLEDRLQGVIETSKRLSSRCAVLFLDLDGFKNVNDVLGHGAGDTVLREVARRLVNELRQVDTVARLGGDEFLILLPEVNGRDQASVVASNLLAMMQREPFEVENQSFILSFSIGIAFCPDDGVAVHELLGHADSALYTAKRAGRSQFAFFTPEASGSETP
ncbi:GGDEF domain-containing protein [Rhodanobacter glycinis]|uniref:GGDEF domain-containing protein n=1 Tax=Rhodanobacter glycinis TaxID=582702 RepID=UPI001126B514|nr:GGDEF domain-containing protein [Rhodanobacter glycinis]TPG46787.1 GGDEF domain-containing protein [Rhodanobacter glycinis]